MARYADYPSRVALNEGVNQIGLYADLQHERGARGVAPIVRRLETQVQAALKELRALRVPVTRRRREPEDWAGIRRLRPAGPRRIQRTFDPDRFEERLAGALLGRIAGCTLGAPIENSPVERMELLARENGEPFPPRDYWRYVPQPYYLRYGRDIHKNYTRAGLNGAPVDDDITYTILGLLTVERFGLDVTTADLGRVWRRILPVACTAEEVALNHLKRGIPIDQVGAVDNPYGEWIGADIRADPWGYLAAGWPERAAEFAYRDAWLSHRGQGLYGAMYFAAAIAAAFSVEDPVEALHLGLTEIPAQCRLADELRWALREGRRLRNYREARAAVDARFPGMHSVHTINNACLTVFGIMIGGVDFTRVIGETVAMGLDNDCTAATAGSLVGAVIGKRKIPAHWTRPFHNRVRTYLRGYPEFKIDDLVCRFQRQAVKLWA